MYLNVVNLDVYYIITVVGENCRSFVELSRLRYCVYKILIFGNGIDWFRLISMFWYINVVIGVWIMKSVKFLAILDDLVSKMLFSVSGYEFVFVFIKKDTKDLYF